MDQKVVTGPRRVLVDVVDVKPFPALLEEIKGDS
jgi:hypothetical protein